MKRSLVFIFFSIVFMCACNHSIKKDPDHQREQLISWIDSIQKNVFEERNRELNKKVAVACMKEYMQFVDKFPEDTLSAEYLFRLSDLARALGDNSKALNTLDTICKSYPEYKRIPECVFLQGYYYDQLFHDTIKAKEYYHAFLETYPEHPLADDTKQLLSMFGKSDEEIIKSIEGKVPKSK